MANTDKTANTKLERCICCGEKTDNFYVSKNPLHNFIGILPYCKTCIESVYNKYFEKYSNEKEAMYYTCRKLDIPFTNSAFEASSSHSTKTGWKIWQSYFKTINSIGKVNNYGVDFDDSDMYTNDIDIGFTEESENKEFVKNLIGFWGSGYKKDEYLFLQEYYDELIKIYDHSLPVQINNYRNMAKTQLQANKCLASGDISGYEKSMKILSMLSGDSNIKPVQETSVGNVSKGGFDVFIKHIEDDEPILDWENDLGNENKLKKLLNVFFFGHLARVLNIKNNPWEKEYWEEMNAYTVEDTEVEEEKNQVNFLKDI